MRLRVLSLAILAGLLLLAGCDGDDEETTVTETQTETADTTEGTETTDAGTEPTPQQVGRFFYSPTRNIGCLITNEEAQCAANEYTYEPPPKPASCELEWGRSVGVSATGTAVFTCIGGLLAPPDAPTLEYGRSTTKGEVTCESSEAGIRCENADGHGFILARERADLF